MRGVKGQRQAQCAGFQQSIHPRGRIPELMRGLGKGVKSFKDGVNEAKEEINKAQEDLDKPAEKK